MVLRMAAVCAVLVFFSPDAEAQVVGVDLAEANNCVSCHRVDDTRGRKRLGPDFNVISERYQGHADVVPYLASRVRSGSRGSWGAVPMPAQTHVSPQDAELLAAWILSLAAGPAPQVNPAVTSQVADTDSAATSP